MTLPELLAVLGAGETVTGGSPAFVAVLEVSEEALRITGGLDSGYHPPERVRELLSELTGARVDESVRPFLPFTVDFRRTLPSARACSSTPAAASKIGPALPLVTAASSVTTP